MDKTIETILVLLFIVGIILLFCLIVYTLNALKPVFEKKKKERLLLQAKMLEEKIKQEEEWKKQKDREKLQINQIMSQLVHEIEICASEKPCPKCNELEILILSLSPNARSLSARCRHCGHEFRIKMEPDNPIKIINLFNSYNSYPANRGYYIVWQMEIKRRQATNQRVSIPTDVKRAVWKRDGGKCVNCGSEVELQYDHIIPVAKGGSSTIQNIQILCKKCNLKKHARIQ